MVIYSLNIPGLVMNGGRHETPTHHKDCTLSTRFFSTDKLKNIDIGFIDVSNLIRI